MLKDNVSDSLDNICNLLNVSEKDIKAKLKQLYNKGDISEVQYRKHVDKRGPRSSSTDELYKILTGEFTPELAYFLGYFWADGHCNGSTLTLEITEEDGENIKNVLMSFYNFRITKRTRPNRKPQMTFNACDKQASELLCSLGKYPKSSESHSKILEFIPEKYHKFFILGLSDGDGSFYDNDNITQFAICSNIDQDWSGLQKLFSNYSFNINKEVEKCGKSSVLRITNLLNIRSLIHWMYDGHNLGLHRKREKANNILNKKIRTYDYPIVVRDKIYNSIYDYSVISNKTIPKIYGEIKFGLICFKDILD